MSEDLRPPQKPTDVRGLIDCCPTQIAYIEGHKGQKASIKNVIETHHTFHVEHRGFCEFCGAEWAAHYSHLLNQIEYRRIKREEVQDDEG